MSNLADAHQVLFASNHRGVNMKLSPYRKSMMHVGLGVVGGLSGKLEINNLAAITHGIGPKFHHKTADI